MNPAADNAHELWVFGYGSLMWRPGFAFAERRAAVAHGRSNSHTFAAPVGRAAGDFAMSAVTSRANFGGTFAMTGGGS